MDYPKVIKLKLASISQYAEKWDITRDSVYDRLKAGTITAYVLDEEPDKTYLNIDEDPQVREYNKAEESELPQ